MCLYVDKSLTDEVKRQLEETGKIICWKEIVIFDGLCSAFTYAAVTPGINKATGTSDPAYPNIIEGGAIHVYLSSSDTWEGYFTRSGDMIRVDKDITIPVVCRKEDFVAAGEFAGTKCACFTKVEYPQNVEMMKTQPSYEPLAPTWLEDSAIAL